MVFRCCHSVRLPLGKLGSSSQFHLFPTVPTRIVGLSLTDFYSPELGRMVTTKPSLLSGSCCALYNVTVATNTRSLVLQGKS